MQLPKLDSFLNSAISEMTVSEYVSVVEAVLEEFKPFHNEVRRSNQALSGQMRSLTGQVAFVKELIGEGLPVDTKMSLVALMVNTNTHIQLEK